MLSPSSYHLWMKYLRKQRRQKIVAHNQEDYRITGLWIVRSSSVFNKMTWDPYMPSVASNVCCLWPWNMGLSSASWATIAILKGVTAECVQKGPRLMRPLWATLYWSAKRTSAKTAQPNLADPDNEKEEPPLPEVKNEYQVINQTLSDTNTQDLNPEVKENQRRKNSKKQVNKEHSDLLCLCLRLSCWAPGPSRVYTGI